MKTLKDYTDLITSEHADKPLFTAMIEKSVAPFAGITDLELQYSMLYDVDFAVGQQLDVVGQWVGVTRDLVTPVLIYFSFDINGLGFDQGLWKGAFDANTGITRLDDFHYRLLIKARILNNVWNGSIENAYELASIVFSQYNLVLFIEDYADLSMGIGLAGTGIIDSVIFALLTEGYFRIKPAGVRIRNYFTASVPGPLFAFDLNDGINFAGFDSGVWAKVTPGA